MDTIPKESFIFHLYPFIEPFSCVDQPMRVPSMRRDDNEKAPGLVNMAGGIGVPNQVQKSFL